ncbi:hypothetical protein D3C87_1871470 [compost metagenome]
MDAGQQQLKRLRVTHPDFQQHRAFAGDGVNLFHLGQLGQAQHLLRDRPVGGVHMHEGQQGPADARAIQPGGNAFDQPVALQALDPFMHRGSRQVQ